MWRGLRHLWRDLWGIDDVVALDGKQMGHVAAWRMRGDVYVKGDPVPHIENRSSYSLQTREGWWVNVGKGRITGCSDKPIMPTVANVYGELYRPLRRRFPC